SSEINPDEVVAMGAAIQGGVLNGDIKDIVLLDVLPLSLGLATRGGLFTKIIPRNSTIPLRESRTFTTVVDNQSSVEIHVLQGEREVAEGNRSLGKFELVGIAPSPRGIPQIEVSFEVDANGIVSVSAQDKTTGREQQMRITPTSGLAPDEIDRLIREADEFADTDRSAKQVVLLRNKLDSLLRNTKKTFTKFGGLLSQEDQDNADLVFADAESASNSEVVEEMNKALNRLERVAGQLTSAMLNHTPNETTTEV
ncbi:MAG TPA: Hsp70 family protein, partial [Pyrinomonadaceae bacterium]|nr:Hsp70 family protein [Pyrinomonadaceae bacterium]